MTQNTKPANQLNQTMIGKKRTTTELLPKTNSQMSLWSLKQDLPTQNAQKLRVLQALSWNFGTTQWNF